MAEIEVSNEGVSNGEGYYTHFSFYETLIPGLPHFVLGADDILRAIYFANYVYPYPHYYDAMWVRLVLPLDTVDTVNSCYIKLRLVKEFNIVGEIRGLPNTFKLWVRAHLDTNSPGPTDRADAIDQAMTNGTSNYIYWDLSGTHSQGSWIISPDISPVIREILDQVGWTKNNHITLYMGVSTIYTDAKPTLFVMSEYGLTNADIAADTGNFTIPSYLQTVDNLPRILINYDKGTPAGTGYDESVIDDLDVVQEISYTNNSRSVTDTITVTQDISYGKIYSRTVDSDLVADQDIVLGNRAQKDIEHTVIVSQTISYTTSIARSVEHTINAQDYFERNLPLDKQNVDVLGVEQDVDYARSYSRSVISTVTVSQTIVTSPVYKTVIHTALINQDYSYTGTMSPPKSAEHELNPTQTMSWSVNSQRDVEDVLTVNQFFFGAKTQTGLDYDIYYQGSGVDTIGGVIDAAPTLTTSQMILTDGVTTITLRRPLFGNQEILDVQRIQRNNRGGESRTFRDDTWPVVHRTKYQFEGINDTLAQSVRDFFEATLGLEITLTDYEGVVWQGFVINPSGVFSDEDATTCENTAEFEFDGVRQ